MSLLAVQDALGRDQRLKKKLIEQEEPVLCYRRKTDTKKKVSFRALSDNNPEFWKTNGAWSFYLLESSVEEALEHLRREDEEREREEAQRRSTLMGINGEKPKSYGEDPLKVDLEGSDGDGSELQDKERPPQNFAGEYEQVRTLSREEKEELIDESTRKLDSLIADPNRGEEEVGETLSKSTKDTTISNKTVLEEALKMGDEEAKAFTREIVKKTRAMVKSSTSLINETVLHDELVNSIVQQSNGTVVQHMTRTYLKSVAFLLYYNNKLLKTSFVNKIRGRFPRQFRDYYHRLLPHFHKEDVVLERVFHSGLQAVSTEQVQNYATGFLVHDVGKARDIEYHEGDAAYDREKVVDHVRQGYTAIMHKTDYPPQAGLITGYHHEYYGHPSGYGYHRAFYLRHRQKHPKALPGYCISYTVEGVLTFNALAYFPAKVLEIIDIYDSLTDPNRVYRSPLSREEALELMQEQFIDENLKIDPILFHIFKEYIGGVT